MGGGGGLNKRSVEKGLGAYWIVCFLGGISKFQTQNSAKIHEKIENRCANLKVREYIVFGCANLKCANSKVRELLHARI